METIGSQQLWSYSPGVREAKRSSCTKIRKADAHQVSSYLELAEKVATLQFLNRDFILLFRGQEKDYPNKANNSSLKPSLMRAFGKRKNPTTRMLRDRFRKLETAEKLLINAYKQGGFRGLQRLRRQQILRWSILQHYEVCDTPLLDVTHSLRVAASFASQKSADESFVFILAVPYISGSVTASAEAGLQIVKLSSACPPSALRPHIQEGYLLGEYPEMRGIGDKANYKHFENDFGRRLVAKFRFRPSDFFWQSKDFPPIPEAALYPSVEVDPIRAIAEEIKSQIKSEFGDI